MAGASRRREMKQPVDPVHEFKGRWWFWDADWKQRIGPYDTEDAARRRLAVMETRGLR